MIAGQHEWWARRTGLISQEPRQGDALYFTILIASITQAEEGEQEGCSYRV